MGPAMTPVHSLPCPGDDRVANAPIGRGGEINNTPSGDVTWGGVTRRAVTPRHPAAYGRPGVGARSVDVMPRTAATPTTTPAVVDTAPAVVDTAPMPAPHAVLLTAAEVADLLRLDVYTVRRYVARGELPAYRVGRELRFDSAELRAYLDGRRS